jgi:hypothetical protein
MSDIPYLLGDGPPHQRHVSTGGVEQVRETHVPRPQLGDVFGMAHEHDRVLVERCLFVQLRRRSSIVQYALSKTIDVLHTMEGCAVRVLQARVVVLDPVELWEDAHHFVVRLDDLGGGVPLGHQCGEARPEAHHPRHVVRIVLRPVAHDPYRRLLPCGIQGLLPIPLSVTKCVLLCPTTMVW